MLVMKFHNGEFLKAGDCGDRHKYRTDLLWNDDYFEKKNLDDKSGVLSKKMGQVWATL